MHSWYIATLRAMFRAEDDVTAVLIADQIKVNGEKDLERGDSLDVTQVTQNTLDLSPEEIVIKLRKARNICIRSRIRMGIEVARELDKFIFVLANRMETNTGFELSGYNYGDFVDVCKEVLEGGSPTHR